MERSRGVLTLLLTIAGVQNNAWPVTGFAIALENYSRLLSSRGEDEEERREKEFSARTKFNFQPADQFRKHTPTAKHSTSVTCNSTGCHPRKTQMSRSRCPSLLLNNRSSDERKALRKSSPKQNRGGRNITEKGTVNSRNSLRNKERNLFLMKRARLERMES